MSAMSTGVVSQQKDGSTDVWGGVDIDRDSEEWEPNDVVMLKDNYDTSFDEAYDTGFDDAYACMFQCDYGAMPDSDYAGMWEPECTAKEENLNVNVVDECEKWLMDCTNTLIAESTEPSKQIAGFEEPISRLEPSQDAVDNEYEKLVELGQGLEGKVHLVRLRCSKGMGVQTNTDGSTGGLFAMKQANEGFNFKREVAFMQRVQCRGTTGDTEHVIKCVHVIRPDCFVMDYTGATPYQGTMDLFDFIRDRKGVNGEELELVQRHAIGGVKALHAANVVHMDIKPENMMVSLGLNGVLAKVTIIDLGFAAYANEKLKQNCGSASYAAPELLAGPVAKAEKTLDIWAVGIVLMVANKCAFPFAEASRRCPKFVAAFRISHEKRFSEYAPCIVPHLRSMVRVRAEQRVLLKKKDV